MKPLRSDQRGQFLIETVLLMIVTIGFFLWGMNQLREERVLAKLISGPWQKVSGMIEAGVWEEPKTARDNHPNQIERSLALDPEAAGG